MAYKKIPLFTLLIIFTLTIYIKNAFAFVPPTGLLLWNKLGSDSEILDSSFGPDLEFFTGISDRTGYVPAVFEGGTTLDVGFGGPVNNLVLNDLDTIINSERGAIEMWYKQIVNPAPFSYGIYRLFDGDFGLGSGMGLESFTPTTGPFAGLSRLFFILEFSGTRAEIAYDISAHNGEWIHIAVAWDRSGIEGSPETMQLYVNGTKVATLTVTTWGTTVGSTADIAGGNDPAIASKFFLDNLKIWNFAKTDYSDRFYEGFQKEIGIDIKPHSNNNIITLNQKYIEVAILSEPFFNALLEVDIDTLTFGKTGDEGSLIRCRKDHLDVNGDRLNDLLCKFSMEETGLGREDDMAVLKGKFLDSVTNIFGENNISIRVHD